MQVQILIPGREDAFENYALAVKASGGVPVFWVPGAPCLRSVDCCCLAAEISLPPCMARRTSPVRT